jgi:uncharacterized protein with PIN domain
LHLKVACSRQSAISKHRWSSWVAAAPSSLIYSTDCSANWQSNWSHSTSSKRGRAKLAFIRFGKGRHPAGLNFGDCVSYALAHSRGLPLLFKGADFAKTDVISALG